MSDLFSNININAKNITNIANIATLNLKSKELGINSNKIPQGQSGLSLLEMASVISKSKKLQTIEFKGSKDELVKYLEAQVKVGDIDLTKDTYSRTIKTNDGKTYEVKIAAGASSDVDEILQGFEKNPMARLTMNEKGSKVLTRDTTFTYIVEEYRNNKNSMDEYVQMKDKYGNI